MSKSHAQARDIAFLKNKQHARGIHTQYYGDVEAGKDDAGNGRLRSQTFLRGRMPGIDPITKSALKAHGLIK